MAHAQIKRIYATAEMADGTIHTDIRILMADQLAWDEFCRKTKTPSNAPQLGNAFMTYNALKRAGLVGEMSWTAFRDGGLVDLGIGSDDDAAGEGGSDPTTA